MSNGTALREFAFEAGVDEYGKYAAATVEQAKDAFAADAGYGTWAKMMKEVGVDDLRVYEIVNGRQLEIRD